MQSLAGHFARPLWGRSPMVPFAIAGIQMPIVAGIDNIPAMHATLDGLMRRFPWVQMAMFSELAAFGPSPGHALPPNSPVETAFREMAKAHRLWLVPGSYFERDGHVIHNTALAIDPAGQVIARYHKMFPFQPYEAGIAAGTDFCVFDVPSVGRFGLSICYDMWFPETIRTLAALGAEVILHPTMTDTVDRDVELSIAQAMAAVNQCYFFDINGVDGGGVGRSIVVDPSGHVLHQAQSGAEIIPIEIDLDQVRRSRRVGVRGLGQPLKSFRDRRVDFSVYDRNAFDTDYLASLGPLERPGRETVTDQT
jgi:deaminated glutathione amidase